MASETKVEEKFNKDLIKIYGRSSKGTFGVVDTMPEKHAYCIGAKLVAFASDRFSGMLTEEAIRAAEKEKSIYCETCERAFKRRDINQPMDYDEHLTGLLIQCLQKPSNDNEYGKELQAYMKEVIKKEHFKKQKYIGFMMLDSFTKTK